MVISSAPLFLYLCPVVVGFSDLQEPHMFIHFQIAFCFIYFTTRKTTAYTLCLLGSTGTETNTFKPLVL